MGRVGEESDFKSQLVAEICSISAHSIACTHRRLYHQIKPHFIDWYLLLRVKEDADIDIIRKQYRKLALQLHPDKNRHPKAEVAFKLVSEAYACLTDEARRTAFDFERCNSFCAECNRIRYETCNFPTGRARSNKILQRLKEIRDRFRKEVRVIENCLKAHEASRKEFPLFDPSDYLFKDYTHSVTQNHRKSEDLRYLRTGNTRNYEHRRGMCESPIFEIRSERRTFQSKSACIGS